MLTTYTGTVPGDAAAHLIPGATGDFDATYGITSDGELRQAELTGVFYAGKPAMTYTLTVRRLRHQQGHHRPMTPAPAR